MFYSNFFLARKGPLWTVWCAAHLDPDKDKDRRRTSSVSPLNKSHYTSTDIPSTVERIMYPEVHIALRMSSHLLAGVVRIYKKKVDYLYHDCVVARLAVKKVLDSTAVNLQENAITANFDAVTLPLTFDDFDFDFDMDQTYLDDHTRSPEEITLEDQFRIDRDPYVVVTVEDEIMTDTLQPEGGNDTSRFEDHNNQAEPTNDFQDFGLSEEREDLNNNTERNDDNCPPEIEVMRDQSSNIPDNMIRPFDHLDQNDVFEPNRSSSNRNDLNEKELSPASAPFQEQNSPFHQRSESPNFLHSHDAFEINDTLDSSGHMPSELKIRSTPPVQPPNPRQRRRNYPIDDEFINRVMRQRIANPSDTLIRNRRDIPSAALGLWKMSNALRKEKVFSGPSLTGCSADICNLFEKDFISKRPRLTLEGQVTPEPMVIENEPTRNLSADQTLSARAGQVIPEVRNVTNSVRPEEVVSERPMNVTLSVEPETDLEMENLRNADFFDDNSTIMAHVLVPSPDRDVYHSSGLPSPFRRDEFTPARTDLERQFDAEFSDIPDSRNIADKEQDLSFLEADNRQLIGSSEGSTLGIESLSVRTRAVAKYLLRQSPLSEDQPEDLSLNNILQGKARKLCARMFFETLVLKSYGLIDVRQDQAYGDVLLKLTSTLAKFQI